ncbi:MAG TPA: hypothetical protein P5531_03070 [Bacteroidales bacterium]|nr:hypothetical protein [Bacteroidales bacterium]HSA42500.1 hypothetical protein [Bacteroidales bacterium]
MKIYHDLDQIRDISRAVVTTGSFDGVHIGHKAIMKRLGKLAQQVKGESVLITFHPHPRKVLYPETAGKNLFLINSQQEKVELLRKTGLDHLLIIPFTLEFSQMTSFNFIRKILVGILNVHTVVVGFNHHFGHQQEGDFRHLYELGKYHGFQVEEIPEQELENETVSSTRIRRALQEGKIQRANAYLDHYYMIMGTARNTPSCTVPDVGSCFTLPVEENCKLIPPCGCYAVSLISPAGKHKAMAIITESDTNGHESGHRQQVNILPLEEIRLTEKCAVSVYFHKLIRLLPDSGNKLPAAGLLIEAGQEIRELIF